MRKVTLTLCLTLIVVTSFAVARRQNSLTDTTNEVAVSYALTNDRFSNLEPIIVAFQVKNNLAHPINIDLGDDNKGGFVLTVTRPNGTRAQLPRYVAEGLHTAGKSSLRPGQNYEHRLLLNEWGDFSEVGKYQVEISLVNPIQIEGGGKVNASTKTLLNLEVEPRNPAVLMQRCAELADKVEKASSYDEALEPALALSYVKDNVAVPYLVRILEANKLLDGTVIAGLGRIATDDAVDALIPLLKNQSDDTAILAGQALGRIQKGSSDPKLKERIERALSDPEFKERLDRVLQKYK